MSFFDEIKKSRGLELFSAWSLTVWQCPDVSFSVTYPIANCMVVVPFQASSILYPRVLLSLAQELSMGYLNMSWELGVGALIKLGVA